MKADDFLDGGAQRAPERISVDDFLDGGDVVSAEPPRVRRAAAGNADAYLDGEASPSIAEITQASRPARMTLTRGGQPVLEPNTPAPEDNSHAAWSDVVRSLPAQAVAATRSAVANLRRMVAEENIDQFDQAATPAKVDPSGWGAVAVRSAKMLDRLKVRHDVQRAELATAVADAAQAHRDLELVTPADQTVAQQALSSLAQSAGPTLLGISAGILTRNVPAAMAIAGGGGAAQQAGSTYGEAREHGATARQAAVASTIDATLEAGGEMLPLGFALKPGTPLFTRIFGTMAREAGQEAATQLAQDLRAMAMEQPDLTWGEVWRNLKVAALAGAGGGAVYGGAGHAIEASHQAAAQPGPETPGRPAANALSVDTAAGAPDAAAHAMSVPGSLASVSSAEEFLDSVPASPEPLAAESPVDTAAHEAATSPRNEVEEPTAAQKSAGNYAMGHANVAGLEISIENPQGSERSGVDAGGKPWSVKMQSHYGYIRETEGRDKDHVDVFVRPGTVEDYEGPVFVIDQRKRDGRFDEHKVMLGWPDEASARKAYLANYTPGWRGLGAVTRFTMPQFKAWISGDTKQPAAMTAVKAKNEALRARLTVKRTEPESHAVTAVSTLTPPYLGGDETANHNLASARPDAIRDAIRSLFAVPINEGGVTKPKAAGIYFTKPRTIHIRNQNDIGVIAHELGHHLSETGPEIRAARQEFDNELRNITPYAQKQGTVDLQREEGMAEFVRFYLTAPAEAKARAPGFYKAFEQYIEQRGLSKAMGKVAASIRDWQTLAPADRIMAKVGMRPQSVLERLSETFSKDRVVFEVWDQWDPLRRMVAEFDPKIPASEDPFKAAHLLAGDAGIIESWLVDGTVPFALEQRADVKKHGKPLYEILQPVSHDLKGFSAYLIARRGLELKRAGKENLFTIDELREAESALRTPAFQKAADEVYGYNDRLVDYAVQGGLLSPAVAAKFKQYSAYIPFFREGEAGGRSRAGEVFKRITGGTENLRDSLSNLIDNTATIIYATNRNAVLYKARGLARRVPGGGRWLEEVPMPQRAIRLRTSEILNQLQAEGLKVDPEVAREMAALQTFFVPDKSGDESQRIIVFKDRGEPLALQVNDPLLWRALQAFEPVDLGLAGDILALPADLLRAGVTLSPDFMSRNFLRDTLSGFIQSKPGMLPVAGTIGGFKEAATRSDVARLYRAFGASFSDMWHGGDTKRTREILVRMAKRGRFDARTILTPAGMLDVLKRLGSISEAGTRIAEFKRTMKPGDEESPFDVDSLIDAAYNAREVSVDFGMRGRSTALRVLTRITPFMNPALQGLYKAARTGSSAPLTTLIRGSALAAASVLLYLNNRDKEWYDDIEQWEKNTYWHFDVGLRNAKGEVIPLRVPKPYEWGAAFASVPEALTKLAIDKQGVAFARRLQSIFDDVITFRAIPTALLVPSELWANKNAFTGRHIVPESKKNLEPALQAGAMTSLTARKVGEAADVSPAKIDHAVRGFLGTMGLHAMALADIGIRAAGDEVPAPATTWRQWPVLKAFVHDPDNPNTQFVTDFYTELEKARRASATYRHLEGDAADAYAERKAEDLGRGPQLESAARQMGRLRSDADRVRDSRDYGPEEKRELLVERSDRIKAIARGVMTGKP